MAKRRNTSEEIIPTLREAQALLERRRMHCNRVRPHSALGYRPPAPETMSPPPMQEASVTAASPVPSASIPRPPPSNSDDPSSRPYDPVNFPDGAPQNPDGRLHTPNDETHKSDGGSSGASDRLQRTYR